MILNARTGTFVFAMTAMANLFVAGPAQGQVDSEALLSSAKKRFRAIYEQGQLRSRNFRGEWSKDGSTYRMLVSDSRNRRPTWSTFETGNGKPVPRGEFQSIARRNNRISPDGKQEVIQRGGELSIRPRNSSDTRKVFGNPDGRSRRFSKISWSHNGKYIALIESDDTDVKLRSMLSPVDPSYPRIVQTRFARVGGKIPELRVAVINAVDAKPRWIQISQPGEDIYLGQVEWIGESNQLLIEKMSRFRDVREFLIADAKTGATQTLFREQNSAWAISSQGKNLGLNWLKDHSSFIVISEKDGWRHAWLGSIKNRDLKLLTPGKYDIIERATIDEKQNRFYYYASPENGTEKYLYSVPLDGSGKRERLTPNDQIGTHRYDFSPDKKYAFHTWSTFDSPPVTELIELKKHRVLRVLEENEDLKKRLDDLITRPTEFFRVEIDKGISIDGWMIKPKEFDPQHKYPVFIYVYGEPHGQTVLNQWGISQSEYHRVIADLGYIVISMDNRGTPAPKGAAWRRAIAGSLGPLSTVEQEKALKEFARTRSFVDLSRVGIWGWSGGGSNTLNAMFRKPDSYHVGIAVVPKPQPHLYNAWFQEMYMKTPIVNPDGYKQSAPINFAEGLKGNLLIVTGSGETNTHIQIVEGLVDRLIELGKRFDYMVYPNRNHGLREGKGTVVHLRTFMARYLLDHLPPGPR